MEDSSSDSDAGERIKNLNRILTKSHSQDIHTDEKYVHKRRLGDLIFDASFEAGNLCHVKRINSFEYELMVRPDIANPSYHSWFNFSVSNQQINQCVVFNLTNLNSSDTGLLHRGLTPVVRSKSKPDWVRLHKDQVFYYSNHDSSSGTSGILLSIVFRFNSMEEKHQFALFYPYSYSNLCHFINRWDVEISRRQRQRELSKATYGLQTIPKMSITEIVVCRRRGNMDSNISLVCQGMMDFLLSEHQVGVAARRHIKFAFLPMLDPDSISAGNSRSDLLGQNHLTKDLLDSNQVVYANLIKVKSMIEQWSLDIHEPVVLLELGVNHKLIGSRILGSYYENSSHMEKHLSFARIMSLFMDGFQMENCLFRKHPRTFESPFEGSSTGPNVNHYLFEISPFAYYSRSHVLSIQGQRERSHREVYEEYDQMKYLSSGVALVYSLLDFFRPSIENSCSKKEGLDACTKAHLDSFHLDSKDIDDLLLIR